MTATKDSERINCKICGAAVHAIETHLTKDHPGVSLAEYQVTYPDAPILSELAKEKVAEVLKSKKVSAIATGVTTHLKENLHEVFNLGDVPGVCKHCKL